MSNTGGMSFMKKLAAAGKKVKSTEEVQEQTKADQSESEDAPETQAPEENKSRRPSGRARKADVPKKRKSKIYTSKPLTRVKKDGTKARWHPGTVTMREIRKYQKDAELLMPKKPFEKLCREISSTVATKPVRFKQKAIEALQFASEDFLQQVFKGANEVVCESGRGTTVTAKDVSFAARFLGVSESPASALCRGSGALFKPFAAAKPE
jgi:histone H3/H4